MLNFVRELSAASAVRYGVRRVLRNSRPITLSLRDGTRFELRKRTHGNNDFGVAYEVFVHKHYADRWGLVPENVRLIVDLGANVGFSLLYFLHSYPASQIIAYEPHPLFAAQLKRNLMLDASEHRVEFHNKAAGNTNRNDHLSDSGTSSSLCSGASSTTLSVEVEDIFPRLLGQRIDILKMDVEGGEYAILADPRFKMLDIGAIVMEWHSRGAGHEDRRWCEERLKDIGFSVRDLFVEDQFGMFWAWR